jgi:hypothetical protein
MYEINLIEGVSGSADKPCDMVQQQWVSLSMMTLGGYVQREKFDSSGDIGEVCLGE